MLEIIKNNAGYLMGFGAFIPTIIFLLLGMPEEAKAALGVAGGAFIGVIIFKVYKKLINF